MQLVECTNCGMEYDAAVEMTCPGCTSGMTAAHGTAASQPGSAIDPRAAGRARAAVEYAEKQLLRERQRQAADRAARRSDRRIGAFQVAFGIPLAVVGLTFSDTMAVIPVYGPIAQALPVLVGLGFAIVGLTRMLRSPSD